ncbi:hypothetical protein P692DRAFT_20900495 [Suillus brevipes Sb2]|nr:hypothetical protein P692DRAFT_20900495 [Suillus brevipes Sb2]
MESTTRHPPCASNKPCLPLIATPLQDASAAPTTHADGILPLSLTSHPRTQVVALSSYRTTTLRRGEPSTYFQVTATAPVSSSYV